MSRLVYTENKAFIVLAQHSQEVEKMFIIIPSKGFGVVHTGYGVCIVAHTLVA